PEVCGVAWEEVPASSGGTSLRLRGDLDACALAVAEATVETGALVEAMTTVAPGLSDVRAVTERFLALTRIALAPPPVAGGGPGGPLAPPVPPSVPPSYGADRGGL